MSMLIVAIVMLIMIGCQWLIWRWANKRISTSEEQTRTFIHLHFGGGVVATLFFGLIVLVVWYMTPYQQFESVLGERLHLHHPAIIMKSLEFIAHSDALLLFPMVLLGLFLVYKALWEALSLWFVTLGGGFIFMKLLKLVFDQPRPASIDSMELHVFWEFPSGHTLGIVIFGGLLLFLMLPHLTPHWRLVLTIMVAGLIFFVGFNRMVVGMHYLGDVLAGYTTGLFWLFLCLNSFVAYRRGYHRYAMIVQHSI